MPEQYDDSNRGAAWVTRAVRGHIKFGTEKVFCVIVERAKHADNQPSHDVYVQVPEGALWPANADSKAYLSGNVTALGKDWFLNVFKEAKRSENSPPIRMTVKAKDAAPPAEQAPTAEQDDGEYIPF